MLETLQASMVSFLSLSMGISMILEPLAYDTLELQLAISPLPISNGTPPHRDHSILEYTEVLRQESPDFFIDSLV